MIVTTNEWGVTDIYPYVDHLEQTAFSARIAVVGRTVNYHGHEWTPEQFAQLSAAMQKAFELARLAEPQAAATNPSDQTRAELKATTPQSTGCGVAEMGATVAERAGEVAQ